MSLGPDGGGGGDPRAFFGRHAAAYARSESHRSGRDLAMLVEALAPLAGRAALDVATGSGFVAVALAKAGARVTALDLTPEMLEETGRLAAREGVEVALVSGDARAVPFADASFDRVASRRAAHHFDDVAAVLGEWRRLLRPDGIACVADMAPPEAASSFQDDFERLRDASHRHALPPDEWRTGLEAAGFEAVAVEVWRERQDLDRWLYPVTDEAIRAAVVERFEAAPAGIRATLGLERSPEGVWSFVKQRVVARARVPA